MQDSGTSHSRSPVWQDKNAAKKKPVEKKDKATRPAVCAADDDDDDFADDAPATKKATR